MRIIEKALVSLAIILVVSAFATQIFYTAGIIAPMSTSEQDKAYKDSSLYRKAESIELKVSGWPKASILINGDSAYPKTTKEGYLRFEVYDRDVVELDLRKMGSKEVSVFVANVSEGISWPKAGTKLFESNGIRLLFKIEVSSGLPE